MFGVKEEEELEAAPPLRRTPQLDYAPDLEDLVERVERPQRRWLERAILLSLLVHALLIILYLLDQGWERSAELRREQAYMARRRAEMANEIPIRFFTEAPGPARREAKPEAPLSDKNRRAGGGDRNRPKAETPYVARQRGIEGLEPGRPSKPAPQQRAASAGESAAPKPAAPAAPQPKIASGQSPAFTPPGPSPAPAPGRPGGASPVPSLGQAIRNATGGPSGLGGAPKANEGGGFVDYGPISFDTQWYDWGDYAEEMLRKIKIHWYEHIPKLAELGPDGKLSIRFYIRADGSVEGESVIRSSDIPPYDHAAFLGISEASPFRPLPKELNEAREGVTITFLYLHYRAGEKPPEFPNH
ncbi:MAG TPA: energy transducer TonB [Thermoanaerobaculia bacterium]|nr:energy transducer TonB [Thermoanaerobaculia bacterium]